MDARTRPDQWTVTSQRYYDMSQEGRPAQQIWPPATPTPLQKERGDNFRFSKTRKKNTSRGGAEQAYYWCKQHRGGRTECCTRICITIGGRAFTVCPTLVHNVQRAWTGLKGPIACCCRRRCSDRSTERYGVQCCTETLYQYNIGDAHGHQTRITAQHGRKLGRIDELCTFISDKLLCNTPREGTILNEAPQAFFAHGTLQPPPYTAP